MKTSHKINARIRDNVIWVDFGQQGAEMADRHWDTQDVMRILFSAASGAGASIRPSARIYHFPQANQTCLVPSTTEAYA